MSLVATMTPHPPLLAGLRGAYALSGLVRNDTDTIEVDLGTLHVVPASEDPAAPPGQWVLAMPPESDERRTILLDVATRLGLAPVRFAPSFERALRSPEAIVLVADTNALLHGTLAQALRLRRRYATHVAVADQAFMEVHRQRERANVAAKPTRAASSVEGVCITPALPPTKPKSAAARWAARCQRAAFLAAARRTLERLRLAGVMTHLARPSDAKVRYLGGSHGTSEDDETGGAGSTVGSNALRDRLMLEAAAHHRIEMPGTPVWLVTGDANLAEQARIEGLNVGFGWKLPSRNAALISAPSFDIHALELVHVDVRDFLDELLWCSEDLALQRVDDRTRIVGRLPKEGRERALAAMREHGYAVKWTTEKTAAVPPPAAGPVASGPATGVPSRAPGVDRLMSRFLVPTPAKDQLDQVTDAYLRALSWLSPDGARTPRGLKLAEQWLELTPTDVEGWLRWMADASKDVEQLPRLRDLVRLLEKNGKQTERELAALDGNHAENWATHTRLANAFGIAVRVGNFNASSGESVGQPGRFG